MRITQRDHPLFLLWKSEAY